MDTNDSTLETPVSRKMIDKKDLMRRVVKWGAKGETDAARDLNKIVETTGAPWRGESRDEMKKTLSETSQLEADAQRKLELGIKAMNDLRSEAARSGKAGDFYADILVSLTDKLSKLKRLVDRRSQLFSPKSTDNRQ